MFWEVGLLVTVLASAISTRTGNVLQGKGMDPSATGGLMNSTHPLRELDAAGALINNTGFIKMSQEPIEFHNENSLEERRGCFPTLSCTRAGGYCIRPKADCNGTVDTQGCRRGRRCKCCIPDLVTSTPLTCPTTQSIHTCPAVTPCPTSDITITTDIPTIDISTTDIPTTDIPTTTEIITTTAISTTYIHTTDAPTTDIPTTLAVTTKGTTVNPNLSWLSVGSDRFVRFPQHMNWFAARTICQSNGLDLFVPKDAKAITIYLDDNFGDNWYWVGSRGNGANQVWLSGNVVPRSAPWYGSTYTYVGTDKCIHILSHSDWGRKGQVLYPIDCSHGSNVAVLCG